MSPAPAPPAPPPAIVAPIPAPAPDAAPPPDAGSNAGEPAENSVFAEALGNGLLYSINYERLVNELLPVPVGLRAGASFVTFAVAKEEGSGKLTLATFPLVASVYLGPARHKLQLGLGATLLYFSASSDQTGTKYGNLGDGFALAGTAIVGYRYLPPGGGFTFGAGFTPLVRTGKGLLWGGINAGYAF